MAGLLAIAVLGLVVSGAFNRGVERGLDGLGVSAEERDAIRAQKGKLAATTSDDAGVRRVIAESFVGAYDKVLWIAVGLSVASALSAAALIEAKAQPVQAG